MSQKVDYKNRCRYWLPALLLSQLLVLAACGGSSSSGDSNDGGSITPSNSLSGTAAAGAPIIGTVTVKGSLGNTKSALIEADGTYNVDVTGLTAPYRLRAQGTVGGRTYKLHSYAEEADVGGNVNITPFTDLIVANAAGQIAESYFDSAAPLDIDPLELEAQEDALQAKLQNVLTALGVDSAINLLNSTFSADRSGLDAALDVVSIEVDTTSNVATIKNLLEDTEITDSVTDTEDNTEVLAATAETINSGVSDIQLIVGKFDELSAAFASGLPTLGSIDDIFADDFYEEDTPKSVWLTDIYTDPRLVGLDFASVVVSELDSDLGTAKINANVRINGILDPEPIIWLMGKDATLGWQIRGDQRIVDTEFMFHCNDNDGNGGGNGGCGINTRLWDEDFDNNVTPGVPAASGKVTVIDGTNGTPKEVIYLGTPEFAAPGDVQVYNEATGEFQGDFRGFGTAAGETDPANIAAGDTIQFEVYTTDLDISTPSAPLVTGTVVATYTDTLVYAPSTTPLYPTATTATLSAIENFAIGSDLTIAWTLAEGTRNDEVLVEIRDSGFNRLETWIDTFGTTGTSVTFDSTELDATAASDAGLNGDSANYTLLVRVYAEDETTGQAHSRDYTSTDLSVPPPPAALACHYESGWDELADGGLGAPINPNSFADYEETLATCASDGDVLESFTAAEIAGASFNDAGEVMTFDALGGALGTEANRGTGTFVDTEDTINFEWWVEDATCLGCNYSYVVLYSDDTIAPVNVPAGVSFRETIAVTDIVGTPGTPGTVYSLHRYSEQSNYSTDNLVRETGSDGEIWNSDSILQ